MEASATPTTSRAAFRPPRPLRPVTAEIESFLASDSEEEDERGPTQRRPAHQASCRLKQCKKTVKAAANDAELHPCCFNGCGHYIHRACCAALHKSCDPPDGFDVIVCGKRCFNSSLKAWRSAAAAATLAATTTTRKRVSWHNDGCVPSVSSLSCVLDWMTTGNNYKRYRGATGQKGDTKHRHASEIVRFIAECGVTTARTPQDVMTKIGNIEAMYKDAVDWLSNTGQGVKDGELLKTAILQRCPHYYELRDYMDDEPSTKAVMLNTDPRMREEDAPAVIEVEDDGAIADDDGDGDEIDGGSSAEGGAVAAAKRPRSIPLSVASPTPKRRKPRSSVTSLEPSFYELKEAQLKAERSIALKNLACREEELELQRKRAADEERQVVVRIEEGKANALKLRYEAEHCQLQLKITLLRERKKLRDEGVPQDEIDRVLPLAP